MKPEALQRTRELMTRAVPDCMVTNFESLIEGLVLPDVDDRHDEGAQGAPSLCSFLSLSEPGTSAGGAQIEAKSSVRIPH